MKAFKKIMVVALVVVALATVACAKKEEAPVEPTVDTTAVVDTAAAVVDTAAAQQ